MISEDSLHAFHVVAVRFSEYCASLLTVNFMSGLDRQARN